MQIDVIIQRPSTLEQYLKLSQTDRAGAWVDEKGRERFISSERYFKIQNRLVFTTEDFDKVASTLSLHWSSLFNLPGTTTYTMDEAMLAWLGDVPFGVFLPRKPEPNGIRLYVLATCSLRTGRPFVVSVWPDTHVDQQGMFHAIAPKKVVENCEKFLVEGQATKLIPKPCVLCGDSLFGSLTDAKRLLPDIRVSLGISNDERVGDLSLPLVSSKSGRPVRLRIGRPIRLRPF